MFLACLKGFKLRYNAKLMRLCLHYLDIHFPFPLVNLTLQFLYELVLSQYCSMFYIFQQDKPRYNILGLINVSKERVPSTYAQVIFLVFKSQLILNAFRYINTFLNKSFTIKRKYFVNQLLSLDIKINELSTQARL